jgi:hypothetical protein
MASLADEKTFQSDPENLLYSRFPRRRLSVEELRDALLAIDGSIDYTMGGSMQAGFGTDGENSNERLSVRPEEVKRRMVYIPLRRANLPSMLNLFDFGDATSTQSRRSNSTVAPQALFMMNSEFVAERARNLVEQTRDSDPSSRVRTLYLRVLNRPARAAEIDSSLSYVEAFGRRFPARTGNDAWMSLARIVISSNEYIYLD